jgi:hypothetical protein
MAGVLGIQGNADWLRHDIARWIIDQGLGSRGWGNTFFKFWRKVSLVCGRKLFLVTRVGRREVVEVTGGLEWVGVVG